MLFLLKYKNKNWTFFFFFIFSTFTNKKHILYHNFNVVDNYYYLITKKKFSKDKFKSKNNIPI